MNKTCGVIRELRTNTASLKVTSSCPSGFAQSIIERPVPLDLNAVKLLKRSPMALDLYGWSAYRVNAVNAAKSPLSIPIAALQPQFGADYTTKALMEDGKVVIAPDRKNFSRYFKKRMSDVGNAYPAPNYEIKEGVITFYPSATPIASSAD